MKVETFGIGSLSQFTNQCFFICKMGNQTILHIHKDKHITSGINVFCVDVKD